MKEKAKENEIHVRYDIDWNSWSGFAKSQGEGFILDGYDTKEDAIDGVSRALFALNKYGPKEFREQDFGDKEFENYPTYPIIED